MITDETAYATVSEAARLLRVSVPTVWRRIDSGRLPAYVVGSRSIRKRFRQRELTLAEARERLRASARIPSTSRTPAAWLPCSLRLTNRPSPKTAALFVVGGLSWQGRDEGGEFVWGKTPHGARILPD